MYRVEKYIEKCITSCLSQENVTLGDDYEIICVDDGSPDKSASIAESFEKRYEGLRVVHQENQGLSGARNTGMSFAQGEYVWFVDSDDWIEPNCIHKLCSYLKDDIDIVEIQFKYAYEDGTFASGESRCPIEGIKTGIEATLKGGVHIPAPFTIFRLAFLKDYKLCFVRGIYHEDVEFKVRALLFAKRVLSIPNICYNYLQRTTGSITSTFKLKNGTDLLFVLDSHYKLVQSYESNVRRAVYSKISMWMNDVFIGMRELNDEDYNEVKKMIKSKRNLVKAMLYTNNVKYVIEGILLSININMGLWLHKKIR